MSRTWTELAMLAFCVFLTGCATDAEKLLHHGNQTMADIWFQEAGLQASGQANTQLIEARMALRRPLTNAEIAMDNVGYTRSAQNEIQRQFHRLPNPDLVMFIFPHLAGTETVPVPGYSTVFPLHTRVHYALPGERLEDY
ncbi:TIGR03751 family conjugal transfer lipoprotein [Pseudomonas huaxiensis]|uniref:TIGR03751 family conjugal transfer lipoprotein n=1 Tax=Pseudomonas huaxiensis TaxID=2213017 RepID=UPI000DA673DD|nr:TIGR03751 family conjugal transfer lipoprotein [Pseudomonas huaxiensis]